MTCRSRRPDADVVILRRLGSYECRGKEGQEYVQHFHDIANFQEKEVLVSSLILKSPDTFNLGGLKIIHCRNILLELYFSDSV